MELIVIAVVTVVVVVLASLLYSFALPKYREWWTARGALDESTANEIRAVFVEQLKKVIVAQNEPVDIRPAWVGASLSWPERHVFLEPFLQSRYFYRSDAVGNAPSGLDHFLQHQLLFPPTHVVLSEKGWWQMIHDDMPARTIIGAINGGNVQVGDRNVLYTATNTSPEFITALVAALRLDASKLGQHDRENGESLADKLSADLKADRRNGLLEGLKSAASLTTSAASLWKATSSLLGL